MNHEPGNRWGAHKRLYFLSTLLLVSLLFPDTLLSASPTGTAVYADRSGEAYLQSNGNSLPQQAGTPLPLRLAFTHITAQQGLSSDQGFVTVQDKEGFIWIGTTNGLNRYSGSNIVVYQHKEDDPTSLSYNLVRTLFVDHAGTLWVGTNSGLNSYDRATDRFTAYLHDPSDPTTLSADNIQSIFQDSSGTMWIGTDVGGLDKFDPATGVFTAYRHDPTNPSSLSNDRVRDIAQDRDGTLWVATYGGGLDKFNPSSGVFTAYRHDPANPKSISSDLVQKVLPGPNGDLWVGTGGGGLNRFDPGTQAFTAFRHDPANPSSLADDNVLALRMDSAGTLWVGTYAGGVNLLDAASGTFASYMNDSSDGESLSGNRVRDLYEDHTGLMWVTVDGGGVNQYNPQQRAFREYRNIPGNLDSLSGNVAYAVYQDARGTVWVGTQLGLDSLDPVTGKIRHYPPDPSNPQQPGFPTIFGITGDEKDGVWVATYGGGLYHLDPSTGMFTGYHHDASNPNSLMDDSFNAIARDKKGGLWLPNTVGLAYFDPNTGTSKAYRNEPGNPHSLTPGEMLSVMVANDGTIWTGGYSGLNRLDPSTGEVSRYQHDPKDAHSLNDNLIFKLYQDRAGNVWAAGFDGILNRFDPRTGEFDDFLEDSPGPAENIGAMLDDIVDGKPTGNLWIWRNHSLVKLDPHTGQSRIYTTADGLPDTQATRAGSLANDGELLLGGTKGLLFVDPTKLNIDTQPPPVVFTEFSLENSQVPTGDKSVLQKSIDQTASIQLPYEQRGISFGYTALSFRGPAQVRYRYMLEGFDPNWIEVDSTRRLATYTNLTAGTYVFHVTASNADGVWNPADRTITLVIVPPWWEMLWFRAGAVVLALVVAAILFWLRVHNFERQRRALEVGIRERTADLAGANARLEAEIGVRTKAESALQQSNEELSALNQIAQTLTEWANLSWALQDVGARISALFDGAGVGIWGLDEQRQTLTRLVTVTGGQVSTENHKLSLSDDPVSEKLLETLQIQVADSPDELPLTALPPNLPMDGGAGRAMLVPLQSRGEPVGLVCIRASTPQQVFTSERAGFAVTVAGTLANAIENSRLLAAERAAAAEEERGRIAAELHDSVTQALYAANLTAGVLPDLWEADADKGRHAAEVIQSFTGGALAQMRTLLVELRPAAVINTSLHDLLDTLKSTIPVSDSTQVDAQLQDAPILPPEVQLTLYRIAQEALNNIIKHARAQHITVSLELTPPFVDRVAASPWEGTVVLRVTDDGTGFDPGEAGRGGMGIENMRERAAAVGALLSIASLPGQGTQVEVSWTGSAAIPGQASLPNNR